MASAVVVRRLPELCIGRTIVEQLLETMRMRGGARGRSSQGDLPLPAGHVA